MWRKEEQFHWRIRVLPETLALALHGETLVVGRRKTLAKKKGSPSIQGEGPSTTRRKSNATRRRNPSVKGKKSNATRTRSPNTEGRRSNATRRGPKP